MVQRVKPGFGARKTRLKKMLISMLSGKKLGIMEYDMGRKSNRIRQPRTTLFSLIHDIRKGSSRRTKGSEDGPRPDPAHRNSNFPDPVWPINFSNLSARSGPAPPNSNFPGPVRPGPSKFKISRPGPAHQFVKSVGPARPGRLTL